MPDYTAIPPSMRAPDAPVTADLIGRLADNPEAIAEGATGAPRVQNAALANDSVNRRTARTGVNSVAGVVTVVVPVRIEMNNYSFFPDLRGGRGMPVIAGGSATPNAATPSFDLTNPNGAGGADRSYDIRWRYLAD